MRTHVYVYISICGERESEREIIQQKQLNVQTSRFKWLTGHEVAININEIKRVEMTKKLREKKIGCRDSQGDQPLRERKRALVHFWSNIAYLARKRASEQT